MMYAACDAKPYRHWLQQQLNSSSGRPGLPGNVNNSPCIYLLRNKMYFQ